MGTVSKISPIQGSTGCDSKGKYEEVEQMQNHSIPDIVASYPILCGESS